MNDIDNHIGRMCVLFVFVAFLFLGAPNAGNAGGPEPACKKELKQTNSKVAPGIRYIVESCAKPLYKAFIVKYDTTGGKFKLISTPKKLLYSSVKDFAEATDSIVALNGGFFDSKNGGFFMGHGFEKTKFGDNEISSIFALGSGKGGKQKIKIFPPEHVMEPGEAPDWITHAVTGIPLIVDEGKAVSTYPDAGIWKKNHPRTGVGMTKDRKTVIFAVVDGRNKKWSKGMTIDRFASLFLAHGAWKALNLDGGCSSTMHIKTMGGVVNVPCKPKNKVRKVHNHIGIVSSKTAGGKLGGFISIVASPVTLAYYVGREYYK